jgi:hypothetical protein
MLLTGLIIYLFRRGRANGGIHKVKNHRLIKVLKFI